MRTASVLLLCGMIAILSLSTKMADGVPTESQDRLTGRLTKLEDLEPLYEPQLPTGGDDNTGIRHARGTCDLLSFQARGISPNNAACAAKCLAQHRKIGWCKNGVCQCRN